MMQRGVWRTTHRPMRRYCLGFLSENDGKALRGLKDAVNAYYIARSFRQALAIVLKFATEIRDEGSSRGLEGHCGASRELSQLGRMSTIMRGPQKWSGSFCAVAGARSIALSIRPGSFEAAIYEKLRSCRC